MAKRVGRYTMPSVVGTYSVAGSKEGQGPLGKKFDLIVEDSYYGEKTWEKAESKFQRTAVKKGLEKIGSDKSQYDLVFAGDLLNQCTGSCYGLLEHDIPYCGLFTACATVAQGLVLSGMAIDGGFVNRAITIASSHFCTAERQFRMPLEYGGQRAPTAQWTVTGSGAYFVSGQEKSTVRLAHGTFGKMVDYEVTDTTNMGAVMAPAFCDTLENYFHDTNTGVEDVDLIVSGDLGKCGYDLVCELCAGDGFDIRPKYQDCGLLVFDRERQDVHAGGSGCGCSGIVVASEIYPRIASGELKNVLFVGTGALFSPMSGMQGENIIGIAHLVHLQHVAN